MSVRRRCKRAYSQELTDVVKASPNKAKKVALSLPEPSNEFVDALELSAIDMARSKSKKAQLVEPWIGHTALYLFE